MLHDPLADVAAAPSRKSSPYLSAKDVKAGDLTFGVLSSAYETFAGRNGFNAERKLVLTLEGDPPRKLSLNETNKATCITAWGKDARQWVGKLFDAYFDPSVCSPQGIQTGGLRIRPRFPPTRVIATATEAADDVDF